MVKINSIDELKEQIFNELVDECNSVTEEQSFVRLIVASMEVADEFGYYTGHEWVESEDFKNEMAYYIERAKKVYAKRNSKNS